MRKISKISLVAAVAVAGFSTANAQPLEEAIKNVDVSGSVVYRYDNFHNEEKSTNGAVTSNRTDGDSGKNNYKIGLNLSSKVNDYVKFNSRFIVGSKDNGGFASLNAGKENNFNANDSRANTQGADGQADVSLSNAYFGFTAIPNTVVNIGKQGLTTPYTVAVDINGNEQTGTGILALTTVGPVTFAGAYFNQTNLDTSAVDVNGTTTGTGFDGSTSIATIGVIGTAGPVTLDAWYLDMDDTFDSYTAGAKSTFDVSGIKLGADARFASLTTDAAGSKANTMGKLVLTADAGLVDGKIAYAMTDKDGGLTALDADASTTLLGWNLNALNKADADYWQAVLGFDILSNLNLSANYGNIQYVASNADMEEEEIYAQLLYKMSKNFTTYVRYGVYTQDNNTANTTPIDDTAGRLQVEYTF